MKNVMVNSNIFFSGLIYRGKPFKILKLVEMDKFRLIIPADQVNETYTVFKRKVSFKIYLLDHFLKIVKLKIIKEKRY